MESLEGFNEIRPSLGLICAVNAAPLKNANTRDLAYNTSGRDKRPFLYEES